MSKDADGSQKVRLLMVCLGNICRSPTAQGVMEKYILNNSLQDFIEVDSAGTGDWHIGHPPDPRATRAAEHRGYAIVSQKARQVAPSDFHEFDYILAMDRNNLNNLKDQCPGNHRHKIKLLLDYGQYSHDTVPDPYYSGDQGFELVLDLVEDACTQLLRQVCAKHFPTIPVPVS